MFITSQSDLINVQRQNKVQVLKGGDDVQEILINRSLNELIKIIKSNLNLDDKMLNTFILDLDLKKCEIENLD